MIIILLVLGVVIGCFVSADQAKKLDKKKDIFILGGIILSFLILFWTIPYVKSAYKIAQLRTFQNVDAVNIERVIERTLSQVKLEDSSRFGLEKMEGYKVVSERMKEWTNKIREYNKELTKYRWFKSNPFTNWFVASVEDLDYIDLSKKLLE